MQAILDATRQGRWMWVVEQDGKQFTAPNDSAVELLILPRY